MTLSKFNLKNIQGTAVVPEGVFDLPEKSTAVWYRGITPRTAGIILLTKPTARDFNSRVVVVKSTSGGDAAAFDKQDGLYTLCIRGLENGQPVAENIVSSSISRVLSAKDEWDAVLKCAHNPEMQVIISNTTEVGDWTVEGRYSSSSSGFIPGKTAGVFIRTLQSIWRKCAMRYGDCSNRTDHG